MTDIHTHILPEMDDGAATVEESLDMLRMEYEQGIDAVVLTSHFYPKREGLVSFLARRAESYEKLLQAIGQLPQSEQERLPDLYLGAEVAWQSDLLELDDLRPLCLGKSKYMLVELPFTVLNDSLIRQLYELMTCHGITPVIAHLERYLDGQSKKIVKKLIELDIPIQISSGMFESFFERRTALKLLRSDKAHVIASDCHDCEHRKPSLATALRYVERAFGHSCVDEMSNLSYTLVQG